MAIKEREREREVLEGFGNNQQQEQRLSLYLSSLIHSFTSFTFAKLCTILLLNHQQRLSTTTTTTTIKQ
jgi:hypothetical protein